MADAGETNYVPNARDYVDKNGVHTNESAISHTNESIDRDNGGGSTRHVSAGSLTVVVRRNRQELHPNMPTVSMSMTGPSLRSASMMVFGANASLPTMTTGN